MGEGEKETCCTLPLYDSLWIQSSLHSSQGESRASQPAVCGVIVYRESLERRGIEGVGETEKERDIESIRGTEPKHCQTLNYSDLLLGSHQTSSWLYWMVCLLFRANVLAHNIDLILQMKH